MGSAYGDGITNGMFYIQKILRQSGYYSNIYCVSPDQVLADRILSHTVYEDNPEDLLLVHYSLGSDHDDWITTRRSPRILVYHNITPAHFFPDGHRLKASPNVAAANSHTGRRPASSSVRLRTQRSMATNC